MATIAITKADLPSSVPQETDDCLIMGSLGSSSALERQHTSYHGEADGESTLRSDLDLNIAKLGTNAISAETATFNRRLQELETKTKQWYEVGAVNYRRMRKQGDTVLPGGLPLPTGTSASIPSRDSDRLIPCRVLSPQNTTSEPKGIFMHIHGGGWVLNDEESSDPFLQHIADSCQLICISVGYRLAPEHPYPAGPNDCIDAAEWLIEYGPRIYRKRLAYIGGESAGANLATLTALALLQSPVEKFANHKLDGLLLHYGTYSLNWFPGTKLFSKSPTLVLDELSLTRFRDAYLPGAGPEKLASPQISPFYADLSSLNLPPALFTCGTQDCLLEDSCFMCTRWMLAGGQAVLKLYPGSPHGFVLFPPEVHGNSGAALKDIAQFVAHTSSLPN